MIFCQEASLAVVVSRRLSALRGLLTYFKKFLILSLITISKLQVSRESVFSWQNPSHRTHKGDFQPFGYDTGNHIASNLKKTGPFVYKINQTHSFQYPLQFCPSMPFFWFCCVSLTSSTVFFPHVIFQSRRNPPEVRATKVVKIFVKRSLALHCKLLCDCCKHPLKGNHF